MTPRVKSICSHRSHSSSPCAARCAASSAPAIAGACSSTAGMPPAAGDLLDGQNRSRRSSLAILNTGSLLTSSQASAKRRIDRSSAHSRLTVAGDSFPPRPEVVPSRATRYSATRRVSSIERLPSLRFKGEELLEPSRRRRGPGPRTAPVKSCCRKTRPSSAPPLNGRTARRDHA
jgi:hypothetical protein